MGEGIEYRILGPLEALRDGKRVALGGPKQRTVLALLLLEANRLVSADEIVDRLWPTKPPGEPRTALQGYISNLRKALGSGHRTEKSEVIETESAGYRLRIEPTELDSVRFAQL